MRIFGGDVLTMMTWLVTRYITSLGFSLHRIVAAISRLKHSNEKLLPLSLSFGRIHFNSQLGQNLYQVQLEFLLMPFSWHNSLAHLGKLFMACVSIVVGTVEI